MINFMEAYAKGVAYVIKIKMINFAGTLPKDVCTYLKCLPNK